MKIKLNRDLWNHKSGETIESGDDRGTWAVNKGYASLVEIEPKKAQITSDESIELSGNTIKVKIEGRELTGVLNKAIEPIYKRNKIGNAN